MVAPAARDHRYEGLLIGGVAVGALGAWMGAGISASTDCLIQPGGGCGREDHVGSAVVGGLIGAVIGGSLGYVIGRWGGSKPPPTAADSATS